MSAKQASLSSLVGARVATYPCSSEINYRVNDAKAVLQCIELQYTPQALKIDRTDGLGIEMADWRLNVESRGMLKE